MKPARDQREQFRLTVGEADALAQLADALRTTKTEALVFAIEAAMAMLTTPEEVQP